MTPPRMMAGVTLSFLNTPTLWVMNTSATKKIRPMVMRPTAMSAPTESPAFNPAVPSNMSVRVPQRLNRGTRPMPVAEMSMAMVPHFRSISKPVPSPDCALPEVILLSAIGPP